VSMTDAASPTIEIEYCAQCGFLARATWMAQELLSTYKADVSGVLLKPGSGGIFSVRIDDALIFSNKQAGRFPEMREVRDAVQSALGREPLQSHKKST
jgi:selenoprotein W-related protein